MQQKLIINAKKLQKQKYRNAKTQNAEEKKQLKNTPLGATIFTCSSSVYDIGKFHRDSLTSLRRARMG